MPNSFMNRYRSRVTGEEYDGANRYADRGYAEYIGLIHSAHSEFLETVPSDDKPDTFQVRGKSCYD